MPLFSRFFGASEGVHIQEVTGSSPVVPTKKAEVFAVRTSPPCGGAARLTAEPVMVTADAVRRPA